MSRAFNWLRRHVVLTSFIVAVLALLIVATLLKPRRLQPGEVVESCGRYCSPNGHVRVAVSKTADGNVHITPLQPTNRFFVTTWSELLGGSEFEAERDWFFCFDEYDRLWLFVGGWDAHWGHTRRLPGGRFRPHVPSVSLVGFWFTHSRAIFGGNEVSTTGDWEGVPTPFFERIPGKHDAVWGENVVIPTSPPELSERQQRMAAAYVWRQ